HHVTHHATRPRPRPAPKRLSIAATLRLMQQRLSVPADGQFGPGTERALKAFQSNHGLTADGLLGPATRKALGLPAGAILRPNAAYFAHKRVKPVHRATHHVTHHATRPRPRPAPKRLSIAATLRLMQQRLSIPAAGQCGPGTERALHAFPSNHALTADRLLRPATLPSPTLFRSAILRPNAAYFAHKRVKPVHRATHHVTHHATRPRPRPAPKRLSIAATLRLMQQRL